MADIKLDANSGNRARRIRVLHVEDDAALAEMYALGLEMQGYDVVKAPDGRAAIDLASSDIDFIVSDIRMPNLSGFEVMALLRENPATRNVPALFLTAYNPAEYRVQAAAVGVEQVLQKGETSPRALAQAIRRQVEPMTDETV